MELSVTKSAFLRQLQAGENSQNLRQRLPLSLSLWTERISSSSSHAPLYISVFFFLKRINLLLVIQFREPERPLQSRQIPAGLLSSLCLIVLLRERVGFPSSRLCVAVLAPGFKFSYLHSKQKKMVKCELNISCISFFFGIALDPKK